jgi:hypothetical protein
MSGFKCGKHSCIRKGTFFAKNKKRNIIYAINYKIASAYFPPPKRLKFKNIFFFFVILREAEAKIAACPLSPISALLPAYVHTTC